MIRSAMTLIEVVIALALGVLLVAGVQVLMVRAHQSAKIVRAQVAESQVRDGWTALLQCDLANLATTGNLALKNNELVLATLNNLDPKSARARSTVAVRYRRESDGTLSRSQRGLTDEEWPEGAVLLRGLHSLTLEISDGQCWSGAWPRQHMNQRARGLRITWTLAGHPEIQRTMPLAELHWGRHD